jgi:crotonobetainyl-CoA:carnitine CoA-transferase CaiB-like acyl-CoA transferase
VATAARSGPFAGVTVLEIGQYVSVPVAGMQLANCGARVIKVEPPEGDPYRRHSQIAPGESRSYLTKNRGKESVALRIGADGSAEILGRLIAASDVLLTNMSRGALRRHGLDYESVRAANPAMIYGTISALGNTGPEAGSPGMDVTAQARSGLLLALGAEADGLPLHSEVQAADYTASALLVAGVAAALYARERTGAGQQVEVSLLGGALYLQGNALQHIPALDDWRERFITEALPRARNEGRGPAGIARLRGELRPDMNRSAYRIVRTADGAVAIAAGGGGGRGRLLHALGLDELAGTDVTADVSAEVNAAFAAQPTAHWLARLREADVAVAEVRHVEELLFDEQAMAQRLIVDVQHDAVGAYRCFGVPFLLSGTPLTADAPSPGFARHTRSVLGEIGFTEAEVQDLARAGVVVLGEDAEVPKATD